MKKKIIITVLCIVVLILLCVVWNKSRNVTLLKDIDIAGIEKIVIYHAPGDMVITEVEDIESVVNIYQSMQLKKSLRKEKDGSLRIDIYYKNGAVDGTSITSKDIIFNGKFYKCAENYCTDFYELYDSLSEKYLD